MLKSIKMLSPSQKILHCKVLAWLDNIKEMNTWGDNCAAAFLAYIFEVNVRIVSNFEKGFYYNDIRTISQLHGYNIVPIDAETIHLYHFYFENLMSLQNTATISAICKKSIRQKFCQRISTRGAFNVVIKKLLRQKLQIVKN